VSWRDELRIVAASGYASRNGWLGSSIRKPSEKSKTPLHQQLLDLADGAGGVEAFGAGLGAVHDGVAAIEAERVFERVEPLALHFVARVGEPAIGLEQRGGTEITLRIPPVARA